MTAPNTPAASDPHPVSDRSATVPQRGPATPAYRRPSTRELERQHQRGVGRIALGVLMVGLGVLITIVTVINAPHSGFYVIAFGPVIYGLLRVVSGIRLCHHASQTARPTATPTD